MPAVVSREIFDSRLVNNKMRSLWPASATIRTWGRRKARIMSLTPQSSWPNANDACTKSSRTGAELVQTHWPTNTLVLNPPPIGPGDLIFNIVKSDSYFLRLNSNPPRPSRIIDAGSGTTTVVTPSAKLACTLPRMPSPDISPAAA